MGEPLRKQISDQVLGAFRLIQPPTYRSAVRKVENVIRSPLDVGNAEKPWIGCVPMIEKHEPQPGGMFRMTLPYTLIAYVEDAKEAETRNKRINRLIDDLEVALMGDPTRGQLAVDTIMGDIDTSEGSVENTGIIKLEFSVVYYRTNAPT